MLKTRILTAGILIAILIPSIFFLPNAFWAALMLVPTVLAIMEWGHLIKLKSLWLTIYTLLSAIFGGLAILFLEEFDFHLFFYNALLIFAVVSFFWVLIAPMWLAKHLFVQQKFLMALLGLLLIASLWLALVCAKAADPWLLLVLLMTISIADTAAYFAGKNFGKHKLAPNISPGKTWEGVYGALIAVTLFALILFTEFNQQDLMIFPLLWAVTILGVIGDLFESLMKRQANLKDSGTFLPGHGGILDRIDGLIPSLPFALLIIYIYHYFQAVN